MVIFHSYVNVYQRVWGKMNHCLGWFNNVSPSVNKTWQWKILGFPTNTSIQFEDFLGSPKIPLIYEASIDDQLTIICWLH